MEETLKDYGYSFQIKVVSALIIDRSFASRIFEILKPSYFDSEAIKWLVSCILKYFQEYKSMPTLEVFKSEIIKGIDPNNAVLKSEVVSALREVMKSVQSHDLEYIKTEISQFCKNQELKAAMLDCIPKLKNGDYDGIRSRIEDAYKKGNEFSIGHSYVNDVEARYNEENLVHITTGWDVIDELTGGGLPKKKLGTVMGALGAGKCVGPKTEIDIQYEQYGIEVITLSGKIHTFWYDPWEYVTVDNIRIQVWKIIPFLLEQE